MPLEIKGETYLSTGEAARYLGVSRPTVDHLVETGKLARYKQGIRRVAYYRQSDLDRLLELRREGDEEEE